MAYLQQWLHQFPVLHFNQNHIFFHQGDQFKHCYYITSGICARTTIDENFTEIILKYYFQNDILGLWYALRDDITTCPATFIAKTAGYAYVIPALAFRQEMDQNFDLARAINHKIINNSHYIESLYQKKSKGNAAEIVCYSILTLLQWDATGFPYLAKTFSQTELGHHLRLHRVTVSKIFNALQADGLLEKTFEGWRILDLDKLSEYANGKDTLRY